MPRLVWVLLLVVTVSVTGCKQLERLTIIRPSAHSRGYTDVTPPRDVSGKNAGKQKTDPALLLASATGLYQRGQLNEAEGLASRVLKGHPDSGDAETLLGLIADGRGDAARAGKYFQSAAQRAPQNGVYANNYGTWLCENGRAEASLPWFDRAVADANYPTPRAALANGGNCARKAGQNAHAEASWRSVLAMEGGHAGALAGMAGLQFERGQYLEARAFVERWLAVEADNPAALQLAAEIERKMGDNAAASRYLSRLQTISPGSTTAPRTQ